MSEHGTDGFNGYAVGEEYRRGCRMTALVPSDMLGYATSFSHGTDTAKACVIMRYGEYPAVFTQPAILVDDSLGDVKQADV